MGNIPDRVSPLHELATPHIPDDGQSSVELSERLCDSLVQVQAWPSTLPKVQKAIASVTSVKPATGYAVAIKDETIVMPTGPGRYLIEDESDDLEARLREAIDANMGSVTGADPWACCCTDRR